MANNGKPKSHTDRARELLDYAAGSGDDEITATHHVHVHGPPPKQLVIATGKHHALSKAEAAQFAQDETPTSPQHPRAQQDSLPEKMLDGAGGIVARVKTREQVAALFILAALAGFVSWLVWGR